MHFLFGDRLGKAFPRESDYGDLVYGVRSYPPWFRDKKNRYLLSSPVSKLIFAHTHGAAAPLGINYQQLFHARPSWPGDSASAFGLRLYPSPYECACVLLFSPYRKFWGPRVVQDDLLWAILWGFLAGWPIKDMIPRLSDSLEDSIAAALRSAMTNKRFALWALSANLLPACASQRLAGVYLSIVSGQPRPLGTRKETFRRLWNSPLVRAQLLSGVAFEPVQRPLYRPGLVWER